MDKRRTPITMPCVTLALLAAAPVAAQQAEPPAARTDARATANETDIVVTANRRAQRLVDVAGSLSAVSGKDLQEMGAQSLADYITKLPSVVFNDFTPGRSEIVIRGVSTTTYHDQGSTVVGYYINDAPMTEAGFPVVIPDVDAFDLNRVELLRGPQGSLFGSASLGGLINYIVNEADSSRYAGAVELAVSKTSGSAGDANHAAKAMLNVPIIADKLALRLVGYQRSDAGYIDNVNTGERGIDDTRTRGLRGSLVATPAAGTRIALMSAYQELDADSQPFLRLGTFETFSFQDQPIANRFWLSNARVDQDLGFANLTVLGSYAEKDARVLYDQTPDRFVAGTLTSYVIDSLSRAHHIEARLASSGDGRFKWLVGANYSTSRKVLDEVITQPGAAAFIDANPADFGNLPGSTLAPGDNIYQYVGRQRNKDLGIFGEVSYLVLPTLEVAVGGRYYDTSSRSRNIGALDVFNFSSGGGFDYVADQSGRGVSPQGTISYRPSRDLTAYAKYARGFRVGGPSPNPPGITGLPLTYDADTVNNYEIGTHASLGGGRVTINAAVFRIDWDNIQVRQFTPAGFSFVVNAGGARIDGVEFAGTWQIVPIFGVASNVTYQDARLSEPLPQADTTQPPFPVGTRLPGSSRWTLANTATLSLDDVATRPRLELSHRYLSKAPVAFQSVNQRGGYNLFDLRLTADVGEGLSLMAFANNLFDVYGVVSAPFAEFGAFPEGSIVRPRTVGLRLNWSM